TSFIRGTTFDNCVIVVDGENINLYKDGSIHDQMLDSGFREIGNSAWLSLGSEKRFHFNGNLDDVRIYNKALTASEISTLFTNY
ncbi:MAG: LamG-like jellyroll fold domain-containing protein, partial [bacterium]